MAIAHFAHCRCVAGGCGNYTAGGTHYRLKDKCRDLVRAHAQDFRFKFSDTVCAQVINQNPARRPIGIDRRDEGCLDQCTLERRPAREKIRNRKRAERVAVPGAAACNEAPPTLLTASRLVLQRDFQSRFNCLRAARDEHHVGQIRPASGGDEIAKFLHRIAGKHVTVAVRNAAQLPGNRRVHFLIAVTEAIHHRPPGCVDVALAGSVVDVDALPPGNFGQPLRRMAGRGAADGRLRHGHTSERGAGAGRRALICAAREVQPGA